MDFPAGGKMQISKKLNLSIAQTKSRFGISDLDYVRIHYFRQCFSWLIVLGIICKMFWALSGAQKVVLCLAFQACPKPCQKPRCPKPCPPCLPCIPCIVHLTRMHEYTYGYVRCSNHVLVMWFDDHKFISISTDSQCTTERNSHVILTDSRKELCTNSTNLCT